MEKIREFMYDKTGVCPECGSGLVPVLYYSAKNSGSTVQRSIDYANRQKVRTTTTTYSDIKPCYAGWCLECSKKEHERKEEEKASHKANPVLLIISVIVLAIGIGGLVYAIITNAENGMGAANAIGAMGLLIGIPLFIGALVSFVKKKNLYAKYQSGYRAPFTSPDEKTLSLYAAASMNKINNLSSGLEYLSAGQVESMQRQSRNEF